jgi:hypothetical protein
MLKKLIMYCCKYQKLVIYLVFSVVSSGAISSSFTKDAPEGQKNTSAPYAKAQNGFTSTALNGYVISLLPRFCALFQPGSGDSICQVLYTRVIRSGMGLPGSEPWNPKVLYCQNMEIAISSPQAYETCGSPSWPMYSQCKDLTYNQMRQDIANYCSD